MSKYFNPLENRQIITALDVDNYNGGQNSNVIDLVDYDGNIAVVISANNVTIGTTKTVDFKLQQSATADGTFVDAVDYNFKQLTDTDSNKVHSVVVDSQNLDRYVKLVSTHGTGATAIYGAMLLAVPRENIGA